MRKARYEHFTAEPGGWTEWVRPIRKGYKMACCDCDLVHTMDFRIFKGQIQFRVARNNRATAAMRRHTRARASR